MLNSSKTDFYRKSTSKVLFRIIEVFIIDIHINIFYTGCY
jgi:hypothetical protein